MMNTIKVLPDHIANKIAAGEVVDRPASVVKELVENALDAGATELTVVIEKAGKELIQVIDNGSGIAEAEVELAFERHATSKISEAADLDRIATLGFRGEALPSIASVSRVEIKTRNENDTAGTVLKIEGGTIASREKAALKRGTTISVKNLFYNTPARRNFLRADNTELNHILRWLKRFFLASPETHFTVINNSEELFNLPAASRDERIVQVFGQKFYDGLVFCREELNQMVLEGYVCRPDQARSSSDAQYLFLNNRAITNRSLSHAVLQGYANLIDRQRYPAYIIFLEVPAKQVDVNVHPTKMEVRFANQQVVYHLFLSAVRRAIQSGDSMPLIELQVTKTDQDEIRHHFKKIITANIPRSEPEPPPDSPTPEAQPSPRPEQTAFDYEPLPDSTPAFRRRLRGESTRRLWQVHQRYIFSQIRSGLVIIDQHLAHQRVLFDQMQRYLNRDAPAPSQQLLFPQTVELSLEQYLVYSDLREWLEKIGFRMNELSGRTLVVEAIPADVKIGREVQILSDIIDFFRESQGQRKDPREQIALAFASKNAIRAGEELNDEAIGTLVDQLFRTSSPYQAPNGQPIIVTLGLEELARKFSRR